MTPINAPLKAYAVSTAVGSGKTTAAVEYISSPQSSRQNFIYVAPTIRLLDQTAENLRKSLSDLGSDREVVLIHSESRETAGMPVVVETASIINEAPHDAGKVVIISTTTFLKVIPEIARPAHWAVIVDEGFSPIEFHTVHLGARAGAGLDHFLEVFAIDSVQGHRVVPAKGQEGWVAQVAAQGIRTTGERYATFQSLAAHVANPIKRCELLVTPSTKNVLDSTASISGEKRNVASESELEIACYVTPDWLPQFSEVTFMSALFEQTLLHHFWTRVFRVTFEEHPAFQQANLRNIHVDQGVHVRVGHLLHHSDRSSRHNLGRNVHTLESGETTPGQRVIDRLVTLCAEYFNGSNFLLQTNNSYGYADKSPLMPANAIKVPTASHGLNEFQDHDNVAALAVTNPTPAQGRWIMTKTGLSAEATNMAYRLHTTYQAVGRSSVRKREPTTATKTFLTVGQSDAEMLHAIFEGSEWLGQVGDMQPLTGATERKLTLEEQIAYNIMDYLDSLPEDTKKVSSRSLKGLFGGSCSSSTWTRAVDEALSLEWNWRWTLEGQSVVRREARHFGFNVEDGYTAPEPP